MSPFDALPAVTPRSAGAARLVDPLGRRVDYLRLSITDRCDLRCVYCMAEHMQFLPKSEVLSLEELAQVAEAFVDLGVRKIRLTGGEPLVRKDAMSLITALSRLLQDGRLQELTLTTNGTRLARFAPALAEAGVRRVNVSLDTRDAEAFARVTRGGSLTNVLEGIAAAKAAGIAVKINTVALARDNARELPDLIAWAHGEGLDITLIETMPLGEVEGDRTDQFLSLAEVRRDLESFWTLTPSSHVTGGPARYFDVRETGGRLGLITPLTHNFCEGCNRVRVTCTGVLHTCLGQDDATDLRAALRGDGRHALEAVICSGISTKPKGHDFDAERLSAPAIARHMSTTGG
jgi:GTP 3',8-cyclase